MDEKNVSKQVEKKVEKKAEAKAVLTIASTFQNLAQKGAKNRKELALKIIEFLKSNGVTKNVRGHDIKEDRVLQQISAMLRDIKEERGKDRGSWWSKYSIVEDEKELKLVPK